jgi:carboxylate-amine ligase
LKIATGGTSADRQVARYEALIGKGATPDEALTGVVDQLIAETVAGT